MTAIAAVPRPGGARPALAFAVAALGLMLFAGMDAAMKGLSLAVGAYAAMMWRSLAGAVIAGVPFALTRPRWPDAATLRLHLLRGCVTTVMALAFFWGLARVPMADAIALTFIAPVIALFLAALLLGERIGRGTIAAAIVSTAGVAVIMAGQARGMAGEEALAGRLAVLGSAVAYAYNLVLQRRQAQAASGLEIALSQNLVTATLLVLGSPLVGVAWPAGHWPALLLAAVLATASLLLLSWAYARAEAGFLVPVEYTAFIWAALFGWLVFSEPVSATTVAGAGLIVAGCLVATRKRPRPIVEGGL